MPKRVAEAGEGGANGHGVYYFIRDLIMEGKDAEFVDNTGRYRLNWPRALDRYADYKAKKNHHSKVTNQKRRKASNGMRSALLNFYKKEGAWEFMESKKVNAKGQVVERQFQMPPRVFEALFSDAKLSDSYEEQDEQERKRHLSEGGVGAQASPESSSDAGFDESMDMSCDFSGSPEPLVSTSFGNFLTSPSSDDSADVRTEGPGTQFSDCAFQTQIFDEDSVESAVEEICSESDETSGLMGVVDEIFPASGSVKGGYRFDISLSEPLPDNVSSGMAEFEGVGTVPLIRVNPFKLCGFVPASDQPRDVGVKVSSQSGESLGCTCFRYVDEMREMVRQLIHDPQKLLSFLTSWSQECNVLGLDMQFQGDVDSITQAKQTQSVKILELLVYTAAQTGAKQFIEMIFSTSAQRIVFDSYKERAALPEDVARANGHCDLAQYFEDITLRLTKGVDNQPKAIDWLELWNAVQNQVYESQDDEGKEETTATESNGNSNDYFADAETSCGSFEHDDVFTSNSEGKDAAEKDGAVSKGRHKKKCGRLFQDDGKGSFILSAFGCFGLVLAIILTFITLEGDEIAFHLSKDLDMANNRFAHSRQIDIIVICSYCYNPQVQNETILSQIWEDSRRLRHCAYDEDVSWTLQDFLQQQQHLWRNEAVTVSRIRVRCAACKEWPAGVNVKHLIDANSKLNNVTCGFSCTVSMHAFGGRVVLRVVLFGPCAPYSFQPCQFNEQHQDKMGDPKVVKLKSGHLSHCCPHDNIQCRRVNEAFNDALTFLCNQLNVSRLDEMIDVKNEKLAAFHTENLTHQQIFKSFNQCSLLTNIDTLTNQTVSDEEPEGVLPHTKEIYISFLFVTYLGFILIIFIITGAFVLCKCRHSSPSALHDFVIPVCPYPEHLSWIKETNMKELQMERVKSWLSCNPNSEEFPSAKDF